MTEIVLTAPASKNATSLQVSALPQPYGSGTYTVRIEGADYYVSSVSGLTLTVTANVNGTTSKYHNRGAVVSIAERGSTNEIAIVRSPGPYAMKNTDFTVEVNQTVPAAITIVTPPLPLVNKPYIILDGAGNAGSNTITIQNYTGGTTLGTINTNGGSFTFLSDGQ